MLSVMAYCLSSLAMFHPSKLPKLSPSPLQARSLAAACPPICPPPIKNLATMQGRNQRGGGQMGHCPPQ